jgi:hypothetical protein
MVGETCCGFRIMIGGTDFSGLRVNSQLTSFFFIRKLPSQIVGCSTEFSCRLPYFILVKDGVILSKRPRLLAIKSFHAANGGCYISFNSHISVYSQLLKNFRIMITSLHLSNKFRGFVDIWRKYFRRIN